MTKFVVTTFVGDNEGLSQLFEVENLEELTRMLNTGIELLPEEIRKQIQVLVQPTEEVVLQ
jgi:hypothetical protein